MKPTVPCRSETRRQRYDKKAQSARTIPVSICAVNFGLDENLAMTIRSAVCYGAESVMVIGSIPPDSYLRPRSGTTIGYIDIIRFTTPHDFIAHCRENDIAIVSAELCDGATDLNEFEFDFSKRTVIVTGNEWVGVPAEVIHNSQPVYLNYGGSGYSLNTAVTSSIILSEFNRQYAIRNRNQHD